MNLSVLDEYDRFLNGEVSSVGAQAEAEEAAVMASLSRSEENVPSPPQVPSLLLPGPPSDADFRMWFPNAFTPPSPVRARLLCFHNNGSNEAVYTQPDLRVDPVTRKRVREPNPLMRWAMEHGVEVLAAQLPDRGARQGQTHYSSLNAAAAAVFPVLASRLAEGAKAGIPYFIMAHSMGCWLGYETVMLARTHGLPGPAHACL
jgi:hypothetical protein